MSDMFRTQHDFMTKVSVLHWLDISSFVKHFFGTVSHPFAFQVYALRKGEEFVTNVLSQVFSDRPFCEIVINGRMCELYSSYNRLKHALPCYPNYIDQSSYILLMGFYNRRGKTFYRIPCHQWGVCVSVCCCWAICSSSAKYIGKPIVLHPNFWLLYYSFWT